LTCTCDPAIGETLPVTWTALVDEDAKELSGGCWMEIAGAPAVEVTVTCAELWEPPAFDPETVTMFAPAVSATVAVKLPVVSPNRRICSGEL